MEDILDRLKHEIADIKRNRKHGRTRPHKLVMLLAVIDLADEGLLSDNCICFDDALISRFERNFARYSQDDDLCQPAPPFFHLRSSPFWHHKVRSGQEKTYAGLNTSGGGSKRILDTIEYVYLSDHAMEVLHSAETRNSLRAFIENALENEA